MRFFGEEIKNLKTLSPDADDHPVTVISAAEELHEVAVGKAIKAALTAQVEQALEPGDDLAVECEEILDRAGG
jgi:hypothetical protein